MRSQVAAAKPYQDFKADIYQLQRNHSRGDDKITLAFSAQLFNWDHETAVSRYNSVTETHQVVFQVDFWTKDKTHITLKLIQSTARIIKSDFHLGQTVDFKMSLKIKTIFQNGRPTYSRNIKWTIFTTTCHLFMKIVVCVIGEHLNKHQPWIVGTIRTTWTTRTSLATRKTWSGRTKSTAVRRILEKAFLHLQFSWEASIMRTFHKPLFWWF